MLYYWEDEKYIIIPLSFNIFYRESLRNKRHISFAREFSISEILFDELLDLITKTNVQKIVALDMQRVNYPGKMFGEMKDIKQKVVFFNIFGEVLQKKMQEDLPTLNWSHDERICFLNGLISENILNAYETDFVLVNQNLYGKILVSIADMYDENTPLLLDSSGLYSNMYITVKKLFLDPLSYYFILYGMAVNVEGMGEFDGFISSSKNGAILANLLGSLLNKKVVHIQGVGPKYSMKVGNIRNEIKYGKSYIYVFDFICTGTELKIISALVNSNDAYLVGAIGFAMYGGKKRKQTVAVQKVNCLITTEEAKVQYKIAGSEDDIYNLMKSEKL